MPSYIENFYSLHYSIATCSKLYTYFPFLSSVSINTLWEWYQSVSCEMLISVSNVLPMQAANAFLPSLVLGKLSTGTPLTRTRGKLLLLAARSASIPYTSIVSVSLISRDRMELSFMSLLLI